MQSSNTPGYQKVTYNQQPAQVNITVNNSQEAQAGNDTSEIHEEIQKEQNKSFWESLVASAVMGLVSGGLVKLGGKLFKPKDVSKEIELKLPDYSKDSTIDQSLARHNRHMLDLQDMRETAQNTLDQNGGYENLSEQSKQDYDNLMTSIDQSQYNSEKALINKWSYSPEETQQIQDQINSQKKELEQMQLARDNKFKFSPELDEEIHTWENRLNKNFYDNITGQNEFNGDNLDILDEIKPEINNLRKKIVKERDDQINSRMKYTSLDTKVLKKQISDKESMINSLEKQLSKGTKPQLDSWLEHLPEQYSKNKDGLIDYVFDSHNKNHEGPFDKEIYRYNKYDGNDPLLYHQQGQNIEEKIQQNQETIKDIAQNNEDLKEVAQKMRQIIPENLQQDKHFQKILNGLDNGQFSEKEALNSLADFLKDKTSEIRNVQKNSIRPVLDNDIVQTVLGKDTISNLEGINKNISTLLDSTDDLSSYINQIADGKGYGNILDFLNKNQSKINSALTSIEDKFKWLNTKFGSINEFVNKLPQIGPIQKVSSILNLAENLTGTIGKVSNYIRQLPSKSPLTILGDIVNLTAGQLPEEIKGPLNSSLQQINKLISKESKNFNIPKTSYNKFEERQLLDKDLSLYDIKDLLSSDLQEQENIVKNAKDKSNIFWRDSLPFDVKKFQETAQKPTEQELKTINKFTDSQQKLFADPEYIKALQVYQDSQPLEDLIDLVESNLSDLKYQKAHDQRLIDQNNVVKLLQDSDNNLKQDLVGQQDLKNKLHKQSLEADNKLKIISDKLKANEKQLKDQQDYLNHLNNPSQTKFTNKNILQKELSQAQEDLKSLKKENTDLAAEYQTKYTDLQQILKNKELVDKYYKQTSEDFVANQKVLDQALRKQKDLNNEYDRNIVPMEKDIKYWREKGQNQHITSDGKIYNINDIKQTIQKIHDQSREIDKILQDNFEKQLNWMNQQKFKGTLGPEMRRQIEEAFHTHSREQESLKFRNKDGKFNLHVPIPTTVQTFYKEKRYIPDTIEKTKSKLEKLGYNPEKTFTVSDDYDIQHPDAVILDYSDELQNKLENLWKEYDNKIDSAKTFEYPRLVEEYKNQKENMIQDAVKNVPKQGSESMNISDLFEHTNKEYDDLVRQLSDNYLETFNKRKKTQKNMKYYDDIKDIQANFPKEQQQKQFQEKMLDNFRGLKQGEFNNQNILDFNQFFKDLDTKKLMDDIYSDYKLKPMDKNENTLEYLWNNYPSAADKYKAHKYQDPLQYWMDFVERQGGKKINPKIWYPYFDKTFSLETLDEIPIRNYIYDTGLGNNSLENHTGFIWDNPDVQSRKIDQAIMEDILPKYNGDNEYAKKIRDMIMKDATKEYYPVVSQVNGTKQLEQRLKNLKFVQQKLGINK